MDSSVLSLNKSGRPNLVPVGNHIAHKVKMEFEIPRRQGSPCLLSRFKELASKADIIHYHFPWPFMDVLHFATSVKKPTVVTYHSRHNAAGVFAKTLPSVDE